MKLWRKLAVAAAVPATALVIGGASGLAQAANAAPVPTGYTAEVGNIPFTVSANGAGASAAVNPADTLSLTVGSPSGSTYAQAALGLPAGSVIPKFAPTFVTSAADAGSPRWVLVTSKNDYLFNDQSGVASATNSPFAADWTYNLGSGWVGPTTYASALAAVGGVGQVVTSAYIVADGDQLPGTTDVISDVQYGGKHMTVKPVYSPVPRLSKGHAEALTPVHEDVFFTQSGAASWDKFTIEGPGPIDGHEGWVNGKIGVNAAVYGGLEANHGYTVYYQPVEGQDSSVPVPGSHIGYVYFVS